MFFNGSGCKYGGGKTCHTFRFLSKDGSVKSYRLCNLTDVNELGKFIIWITSNANKKSDLKKKKMGLQPNLLCTIVCLPKFYQNPLELFRPLRVRRVLDLMVRRFQNPRKCRKTWMNNNCYHPEIIDSIIFPFYVP